MSPARRTPTKALDNDPGLEFEYFLAAKLGMTRARLLAEMSALEFVHWSMYYAREAQRKQLANGGA